MGDVHRLVHPASDTDSETRGQVLYAYLAHDSPNQSPRCICCWSLLCGRQWAGYIQEISLLCDPIEENKFSNIKVVIHFGFTYTSMFVSTLLSTFSSSVKKSQAYKQLSKLLLSFCQSNLKKFLKLYTKHFSKKHTGISALISHVILICIYKYTNRNLYINVNETSWKDDQSHPVKRSRYYDITLLHSIQNESK